MQWCMAEAVGAVIRLQQPAPGAAPAAAGEQVSIY
jgi:hypothetical protein